jgi:hypothetical protein
VPGGAAVRELVGGPLDGLPVAAAAARGAFAWVDGDGRCHAFTAPGRALYIRDPAGRLAFAGFGGRACGGCGAILRPEPCSGEALAACPLCGAARDA